MVGTNVARFATPLSKIHAFMSPVTVVSFRDYLPWKGNIPVYDQYELLLCAGMMYKSIVQ